MEEDTTCDRNDWRSIVAYLRTLNRDNCSWILFNEEGRQRRWLTPIFAKLRTEANRLSNSQQRFLALVNIQREMIALDTELKTPPWYKQNANWFPLGLKSVKSLYSFFTDLSAEIENAKLSLSTPSTVKEQPTTMNDLLGAMLQGRLPVGALLQGRLRDAPAQPSTMNEPDKSETVGSRDHPFIEQIPTGKEFDSVRDFVRNLRVEGEKLIWNRGHGLLPPFVFFATGGDKELFEGKVAGKHKYDHVTTARFFRWRDKEFTNLDSGRQDIKPQHIKDAFRLVFPTTTE